ncbi:MAG: bifunctional 2-polyprenyl-6-hydroxyphenol methylase/3-demethylubiquinol 3-O-methyltransferase UbiG [Gammaproteobacteria bacterium]|nr:bifunctional 2-polyprenyl-6-hydroxyphenol methylase/3-demethylubiquinol 3-O-methyltransferase UbiG [Gammaproteobacteria bacterium]MDE0302299.1 bifunctional 2-polyprenyl-6-hydroxyphenol methylase/3-demethylubiquinol 3-O-methyltransferase UbiG [Gammaproteobacteria bacterium]MDE0611613.1 bifunctional 2-polyprenyl-6-hydroxyphenol methylase/3-demethylubiquinol 3-O-methyltransferase UbiG [Gammaproteobacteria bacterium]
MTAEINQDPAELAQFDGPDLDWWDPQGPMQALHAINPARFQYIEEHCELAGQAVLDIGCGGGLLTESLARAGAGVTGLDLSGTALEQARAHAQEQALDIEYLEQDAHALAGQRPETFDVVTCMELLEHVPDFPALLGDCEQLLHPGGFLFVSTLNRTVSAFMLAIVGAEHLAGILPVGTHRYDRFIRPSELAQTARDLRLVVEDIRGIAYNPLTRTARLGGSPRVNYLMRLRKAAQA